MDNNYMREIAIFGSAGIIITCIVSLALTALGLSWADVFTRFNEVAPTLFLILFGATAIMIIASMAIQTVRETQDEE